MRKNRIKSMLISASIADVTVFQSTSFCIIINKVQFDIPGKPTDAVCKDFVFDIIRT